MQKKKRDGRRFLKGVECCSSLLPLLAHESVISRLFTQRLCFNHLQVSNLFKTPCNVMLFVRTLLCYTILWRTTTKSRAETWAYLLQINPSKLQKGACPSSGNPCAAGRQGGRPHRRSPAPPSPCRAVAAPVPSDGTRQAGSARNGLTPSGPHAWG